MGVHRRILLLMLVQYPLPTQESGQRIGYGVQNSHLFFGRLSSLVTKPAKGNLGRPARLLSPRILHDKIQHIVMC